MKNAHLNLFKFFNEAAKTEVIENNLSRAFALCLANDPLFLNEYIKAIIEKDDFDSLFQSYASDMKYEIDLQIEMSSVEVESIRKVYAIAMTTEELLEMKDFLIQKESVDKARNITDILITIKDIALVIEVKRTGEDCRLQLFNQICSFLKCKNKIDIIPLAFSWQKTIKIMETVLNLEKVIASPSVFLVDFLKLSEGRYPEWFSTKPFKVLPFKADYTSTEFKNLFERLKLVLSQCNHKILGYNDRLALSINFPWASEVIPDFKQYDHKDRDYLILQIWPGNTKGQGYSLFNKQTDWTQKTSIELDGKQYEMEVAVHLKFCHFNRYISSINLYQSDLLKRIDTKDNFYDNSGKWNMSDSKKFEEFMDEHIKDTSKWRTQVDWEDKFIGSDRSYFTISIGYEVSVFVPFYELSQIDIDPKNLKPVASKIDALIEGFEKLIENK